MTVTPIPPLPTLLGAIWEPTVGYGGHDIHIVRDGDAGNGTFKTADLRNQLKLIWDNKDPEFADATTLATVSFFTNLTALQPVHNLTVDPISGIVTTTPGIPADDKKIRNFVIVAKVEPTLGLATGTIRIAPIRVHIHDRVSAIFLSPDPLILRAGERARHAIFMSFDDQSVGDVSYHPDFVFHANSPLSIDPARQPLGFLTVPNGTPPTVGAAYLPYTVDMPNHLGGKQAVQGNVQILKSFSDLDPIATWEPGGPGPKARGRADVRNVLLLPDGFTSATTEKELFLSFASKVAKGFEDSVFRPYPDLARNINFYSLWIDPESTMKDNVTDLMEHYQVGRKAGVFKGKELPIPTQATFLTAPPPISKLPDLVYRAGLPAPIDLIDGSPLRNYINMKTRWASLYGGGHVVFAGATPAAQDVLGEKLFSQWVRLRTYRLSLHRNTLFGVAGGELTQVFGPPNRKHLGFHPFRNSRAQLDRLLAKVKVKVKVGGAVSEIVIGDRLWADPAEKKDRNLVVFICKNSWRNGEFSADDGICAGSTTEREDPQMSLGGNNFNVDLSAIPAKDQKLPFLTKSLFVHETSHALLLGDEYGDTVSEAPAGAPGSNQELTFLPQSWNLQNAKEVAADTGPGVKAELIRWRWPRVAKAGMTFSNLLEGPTLPDGSKTFKVTMVKTHASPFKKDDVVRIRTQRPLLVEQLDGVFKFPQPSTLMVIIDPPSGPKEPDVLWLKTMDGSDPPTAVQDRVLYAPKLNGTVQLLLLRQDVANWMTAHGPLTRETRLLPNGNPGPDGTPCDPTKGTENFPNKLRPGVPQAGKYGTRLVGLHDGGFHYRCGIYHPTGDCLMRRADALQFCPVCMYILIDLIDPTKHPSIDSQFDP